jgi:hypothetical protein
MNVLREKIEQPPDVVDRLVQVIAGGGEVGFERPFVPRGMEELVQDAVVALDARLHREILLVEKPENVGTPLGERRIEEGMSIQDFLANLDCVPTAHRSHSSSLESGF